MGRVSVKCLVLGRDDVVRRVSGRMFLECVECGRETTGWVLSRCGERDRGTGSNARARSPMVINSARPVPDC